MKKVIALLVSGILLISVSALAATTTEPISITPEVFVERYNDFLGVFFSTFGQKYQIAKIAISESNSSGEVLFSIITDDVIIEGYAINNVVHEVTASAITEQGVMSLFGVSVAVSNMPDVASFKSVDSMDQYILLSDTDDDVAHSNGYVITVLERTVENLATAIIISTNPE